jgi:hypothetical protein
MSSTINRDEWLQALKEANCYDDADDADAVTAAEFAVLFDTAVSTAWYRLKRLAAAGRAERTKKWTTDTRGRRVHCAAYRLIAPKKKARRPA